MKYIIVVRHCNPLPSSYFQPRISSISIPTIFLMDHMYSAVIFSIYITNSTTCICGTIINQDNFQEGVRAERKGENQGVSLGHPKAQGIPFSELALPTLKTIFQSANGYYMWMTYKSGTIYYIIIGLIHLTFLAIMINTIWKNRRENLFVNIKSAYSLFSFFLMILVVLLYCWMVTYQPQGRYLLMVWLFMGYLCAQYKDAFDSRALRSTIVASMCAGFWSFGYYGIFTMLKNGCLFVSYQKILNILGFFFGNL